MSDRALDALHASVDAAPTSSDPTRVLAALRSASALCAPTERASFCAAGGVLLLLRAMRRYAAPADARLQCSACDALASLADVPAAPTEVSLLGGFQDIRDAMDRYEASAEVQYECCRALAELARRSPVARSCVAELCLVPRAVRAMRSHPLDPRVQLSACRVVHATCSGSPEAQLACSRVGAARCVVEAARGHRGDAGVVEAALAAAEALAGVYENRAALCSLDAVPAILGAACEHGTHAGVVRRALGALESLMHSQLSAAEVERCGALDVALGALRVHAGDASVVYEATYLLVALLESSPRLAAGGVWEAVSRAAAAAMSRHPACAEVQAAGCALLRTVTRVGPATVAAAAALRSDPCVRSAAVRALRCHLGSDEVVRQARALLLWLCGPRDDVGCTYTPVRSDRTLAALCCAEARRSGVRADEAACVPADVRAALDEYEPVACRACQRACEPAWFALRPGCPPCALCCGACLAGLAEPSQYSRLGDEASDESDS
eukprot:m51a1_g4444 hypothetical protein (497) ;mRNA; f:132031-133836